MLGANENRLDLRQGIDSNSLLIVNLGGFQAEEAQRLLGAFLITALEQAALSRSNQAPDLDSPQSTILLLLHTLPSQFSSRPALPCAIPFGAAYEFGCPTDSQSIQLHESGAL